MEEIECYDPERELPFYNLGSFTWEIPELNLDDLIGRNVRDCLMLNRCYDFGITYGDVVYCEGDTTLILEYDKTANRVTKAYFKND